MPEFMNDDGRATVTTLREAGKSAFLLVCDHAGNALPRRLGTLGLQAHDLERHIAWDIGAAGVTRMMADKLDAVAILQTWSRLVIDCNRPPTAEDSIATVSEDTPIPANRSLPEAERERRLREIFLPYHAQIHAEIDRRQASGLSTILVAIHSFTPVYKSVRRPWHVGVLYNRDDRLAKPMIAQLRQDPALVVGDNQPYTVSDESDYTIPIHGERRGLPHIEIEIRQDMIADEEGQRIWADRLTDALTLSSEIIPI